MQHRRAFTLIELLVVIGIIALLVSILMPSLARVRELAKATSCLTNLRGIGQGLVVYQNYNNGCVVPSYNMPKKGTSSAAAMDVLEGWAAILERDGLVPGSQGMTSNIFYCPSTKDIEGMTGGQTGYDQNKPSGYHDWPIQFLAAGGDSVPKADPVLPIPGFGNSNGPYFHEIRCGYYLNAYNPIGTAPSPTATVPTCAYYTQCVGFGPYADGNLQPVVPTFASPASMIVACDGMYVGRQGVTRLGEQNRRIGYRHPGKSVKADVNGTMTAFTMTVANTVFADGHAAPIHNNDFPHATVPSENVGRYSLLANP